MATVTFEHVTKKYGDVLAVNDFNLDIHDGELVGKKQDKAGHWRTAKVPHYSTDPVKAYAIDERMIQLGRSEKYAKELSKIAKAKKIPVEWLP